VAAGVTGRRRRERDASSSRRCAIVNTQERKPASSPTERRQVARDLEERLPELVLGLGRTAPAQVAQELRGEAARESSS
jgi:hypothetical protein